MTLGAQINWTSVLRSRTSSSINTSCHMGIGHWFLHLLTFTPLPLRLALKIKDAWCLLWCCDSDVLTKARVGTAVSSSAGAKGGWEDGWMDGEVIRWRALSATYKGLPIHFLNIASTTQKNPLLEAVVDQKSKHKQWRQVGREVGSMDHSYRIGHDYIERWSGLEGPVGFCSKFSVLLYFKYIDTAEIWKKTTKY